MSKIRRAIEKANAENRLALNIYLTGGYPTKENFVKLALGILDSGADMLEIGIPFSDPLADGPVIQKSSYLALQSGVNLKLILDYVSQITRQTDKPIILMGYLNPIIKYGKDNFINDAIAAGVAGLIIPDMPLEEHVKFVNDDFKDLDVVLLTTPTSPGERINEIDKNSNGFVYCVSVTGTTGERKSFDDNIYYNLERTYKSVSKNKMLIGFGISKGEDVRKLSPYCDGVIVGSAVIRSLENSDGKDFSKTYELVKEYSIACKKE